MDNMRGRSRGRRPRTRPRGRPKKNVELKEEEEFLQNGENEIIPQAIPEIHIENQIIPKIDMEADISQLEPPTFTTINRGPPEAMLRLRWGHPVNLLGEKVLNPMIHCCDQCLHPILIYGRMIPCKHVFCLSCAKSQSTECPRCKEKLIRVEETGLGSLVMCTHGGSRYGNNGCRRTYLSDRDLQAHINHRHVTSQGGDHINQQFNVHNPQKVNEIRTKSDIRSQNVSGVPSFYENEKQKLFEEGEAINYNSANRSRETNPSMTRSSNLITVPLQGQSQDPYYINYNGLPGYFPSSYPEYVQPQPSQTDVSLPPPQQQWPNNQQFYG